MNSITQIQDTLDEHKERLPDSVYLKLCNQMKDLYNEQNRSGGDLFFTICEERNMYKELHDINTEQINSLEEQIELLEHKNSTLKCKLESADLCQKVYLQCRDELYERFYITCKCKKEVLKTSFSRHKKSKQCIEFHKEILE